MTLYETMMQSCTKLQEATKEDSLGGYSTEYSDGESFMAAITNKTSAENTIAEKLGVSEGFTVTVRKDVSLKFGEIIRRNSDGAMFKVTSNVKDSETPSVASFQFAQVSAERWVKP